MFSETLHSFSGGSHIITPAKFLDDVKALSGGGGDGGGGGGPGAD